jgi:hypothetical protein
MTENMSTLLSTAAKEIVQQAQALGLTWTLRMATVVSSSFTKGVSIVFDGDTVAIAATNIANERVNAGDRVYCVIVPQAGNFVFGFADPIATPNNYNAGSAGGSTVSASYGNMPNSPTVEIEKSSMTSYLLVCMQTSCYNSAISGIADIGILAGGTDFTIVRFFFNQANVHASMAGTRLITSVPAGRQTLNARWRQSGAGTLTQDTNDWISITVSEVRAHR